MGIVNNERAYMDKLYTDEEKIIGAKALADRWGEQISPDDLLNASLVLDAVLPVYRERLVADKTLALIAKTKGDVDDRLVKENKRLKLENEKLLADLEWQQFHR